MKKIKLTGAKRYVLRGQLYEKGKVYTVNDKLFDELMEKTIQNSDTNLFNEARQKDEALPVVDLEVAKSKANGSGKAVVVQKNKDSAPKKPAKATTAAKPADGAEGGEEEEPDTGGESGLLGVEDDPDAPKKPPVDQDPVQV